MPEGLYAVLSLSMRYWFVALGFLIVFQTFLWLGRDRREKHRMLAEYPDAGMVGEFVVTGGTEEVPEGSALPVPWDGMLGSDRSCDVVLPSPEVGRVHLYFSFEKNRGLSVECAPHMTCTADGEELGGKRRERQAVLDHGSVLTVGPYTLRLRLFAGLHEARDSGYRAQDDVRRFGRAVVSQAVPVRGEKGWDDPQTELERYDGPHLAEKEAGDTDRERKASRKGKGEKGK